MATEIFVSYSHRDAQYLEDDSLLGHLKGLERDGARFWCDEKIEIGLSWDDSIRKQIDETDIALVLVSQMFLNSKYCRDTEIPLFLKRERDKGLIIFPVILSACDWQQYPWLRSRQFIPAHAQNIEEHYYEPPGKRKAMFQTITEALRRHVTKVEESKRNGSANTSVAMKAFSQAINLVNRLYAQVMSFHHDAPEEHHQHSLDYQGLGDSIVTTYRTNVTTLTADDLRKLSDRQLRHISIFQEELEASYERWERLYRQRRHELPRTNPATTDQLRDVLADMRESLNRVYGFMRESNLDITDHYAMFESIIADESNRAGNPSATV
jgi:hypothetical protein